MKRLILHLSEWHREGDSPYESVYMSTNLDAMPLYRVISRRIDHDPQNIANEERKAIVAREKSEFIDQLLALRKELNEMYLSLPGIEE